MSHIKYEDNKSCFGIWNFCLKMCDPSILLVLKLFFHLHPTQVSLRFGLVWRLEQSLLPKVFQKRLSWLWSTSKFWHFPFLLLYSIDRNVLIFEKLLWILFPASFCIYLVTLNNSRTVLDQEPALQFFFLLGTLGNSSAFTPIPIYFRFRGLENLLNMSRKKWLHGGVKAKTCELTTDPAQPFHVRSVINPDQVRKKPSKRHITNLTKQLTQNCF